MIVCLCRGVSDRSVRLAVVQGARSLDEVTAVCGAGAGCGGCHEAIDEIVAQSGGGPGPEVARCGADCAAAEHRLPSPAVAEAG